VGIIEELVEIWLNEVCDTPPLTDDKSNESAIEIWNEKNHKALSTISLHINDSALVYIAGAKTLKEA